MNAKRGYDDKENLMKMAAGLDDGTFTSVHQAARFVLHEDGGPNVDRLRRKYRAMQRSEPCDVDVDEFAVDPSDWWKVDVLDLFRFPILVFKEAFAFLLHPARLLRKALRATTPAPLMLLLVGLFVVFMLFAMLLQGLYYGLKFADISVLLIGSFFAATFISASSAYVEMDCCPPNSE